MDFLDLCKSMNIVSTLPEYVKPKNVGLMFFNLEPDRFFPYAQIDVVEFPDDTGSEIREKTFKGPLHQQLREALLYIKNSILQEQVVKVDDAAEARRFFNYPYAAVEEALTNAVYHNLWKAFHKRCYVKLIVMQRKFLFYRKQGLFSFFNLA